MSKRIVDEEMRFSIVINGNEAQQELFEVEKATRKLSGETKELRAEKSRLKALGKQETEEYKKISAAIKENTATMNANKTRMAELRGQIGITSLTMGQLRKEASRLKLQLHNMTPGSAEYKKFEADLQAVNARMKELRGGAVQAESAISRMAGGFNKYFALATGVIATGTGMVLSLQKVIDFNGKLSDSQADVMKTTGLTREEVDELTKSLGMLKTRTTRAELLGLAEQAGRLGITGVKNLQDFIKSANEIKVALGDDLSEEAIQEVGKITNIYKVGEQTGKDFAGSMTALGSAINEVSASGANQAGFLVDYLKRQSGIAAQAKIGAAENIGYAATFDEIGQSVEVSATAMNKVWMDLFENTATYADIAKMSVEDFTALLNSDANEAMIRFLEGLDGNNEGLAVMTEKLKDLEVGGARGAQSLSALAGNTDLLRGRQVTANQALKDATSITDEYNIKNNNLAATLEKVQKTMIGWFSSSSIMNGMNAFIQGFAKLIGATEDLNDAFAKETEATYESARSKIQAANASRELLDEYESLTADGVEPTEEAKRRLEEITVLLRDRLGESVVAIDAETGALKLNTDAVREQIKLKRLSADEEASTLISRMKGAEEEKKRLKEDLPTLQKEYDIRKRLADQARVQFKESEEYERMGSRARLGAVSRLEEVKKEQEAFRALNQLKGSINEQDKRRADILERLQQLNYTASDVDLMFQETEESPENEPKDGDEKLIGGLLYVYSNGKWSLKNIGGGSGSPGGSDKPKYDADREREELRQIQEENSRLKASLINEDFQREIALEEANHNAKIAKLKAQITEKAELKAMPPEVRAIAIEQNKALNEQIQDQEKIHQLNLGKILEKGLQDQIQKEQEQYERERVQREIKHNEELALLGNNSKAKEELQKKFNKQEEDIQVQHLQDVIARMREIMGGEKFKKIKLELLSEEQKQELFDALDQLGLKLSDLIGKKNELEGSGSGGFGDGAADNVDILGFSISQWEETFANLDTTKEKIAAAEMAIGAMMNVWGMYSNFLAKKNQVELQEFERTQDQKRESLDRQLDRGYINQRQYNRSVEALEKESQRKRAEMEYEQAKREKETTMANIVLNTALGVMKAVAASPLTGGMPWSAIVGAVGAIQLGIAAATPLPAKGYEEGLYPVEREQDGKMFNASYGGETRSGLVSKPTLFLAGERRKPEMVIDDRAWAKMNPDVKNSLYRELGRMGRVPGYENGYYKTEPEPSGGSTPQTQSTDPGAMALAAALDRNSAVMERIEKEGVRAILLRTLENAKKIDDDIKDYHKLRNENKR
jgi:hypothetical protein